MYWCHRPVVDFTKESTEDYNNNYIIFNKMKTIMYKICLIFVGLKL